MFGYDTSLWGKKEFTLPHSFNMFSKRKLIPQAADFRLTTKDVTKTRFIITIYFRYIVKSSLFSTVPLFGFFTLVNVGFIILILGVLGLYIANIHQQTLNRPKYHISKIKKN